MLNGLALRNGFEGAPKVRKNRIKCSKRTAYSKFSDLSTARHRSRLDERPLSPGIEPVPPPQQPRGFQKLAQDCPWCQRRWVYPKEHEMPAHHNLDRYLEEYIAGAGIAQDRSRSGYPAGSRRAHFERQSLVD
jgi:hypothetical protein